MNVVSAMAGICDGNFCKKFTNQNVDIITLGGYNLDDKTYHAGLENIKNGRKEFDIKPDKVSYEISKQIKIIKDYNPLWNGFISANVRLSDSTSLINIYDNEDIDILEINAHCRQKPMIDAKTGQYLLTNLNVLSDILENITSNWDNKICLKIRANVNNVDMLDVIDVVNSFNIDYLHVDAMNPYKMAADLNIIKLIRQNSDVHIIGNNCINSHQDYLDMIEAGANSVSVARFALNNNVSKIFI